MDLRKLIMSLYWFSRLGGYLSATSVVYRALNSMLVWQDVVILIQFFVMYVVTSYFIKLYKMAANEREQG